jgi:hypothetical protein
MQTTAAATSTRTFQAGDRRRPQENSLLVRADRTLFLAPFSFICKPIIFVNTGSGQTRGNHSETTVWLAGKGPLTDGLYHYESEVQATIDFGFDGAKAKQSTSIDAFHKTCHMETGWICFVVPTGIKLDGCGEFLNLTVFANLMNKTGKPILIENCHWGHDGPGDWVRRGRRTPTTWPTIVLNLKHTQLNSNVFVLKMRRGMVPR